MSWQEMLQQFVTPPPKPNQQFQNNYMQAPPPPGPRVERAALSMHRPGRPAPEADTDAEQQEIPDYIPHTRIPDYGQEEGAYFPDRTPQTEDVLGPDPPNPPRGLAVPVPQEHHKLNEDMEELMEPGEKEPSQISRDRMNPPERRAGLSRFSQLAQADTGTMSDASPPAIDLPQVDVTPEAQGQLPATKAGPDMPGRTDYAGQAQEQKGWMQMLGDMINPVSPAQAKPRKKKDEPPADQPDPMAPEPAPPPPPEKAGWDRLTDPEKGTFPFNYPSTYRGMVGEDIDRVKRGWGQLTGELTDEEANRALVKDAKPPPEGITGEEEPPGRTMQVLKGIGNIGLGGLGYIGEPIAAATRSIVGQPVQNATGLPREYTEFATQLAIPGLGLPKSPGMAGRAGQAAAMGKAPNTPAAQAAARALGQIPKQGTGLRSIPQRVFAPETVSGAAEDAASFIRETGGRTERTIQQDTAALKAYMPAVDKMTTNEQLALQNYIDGGRTAHAPTTPEARALADTIKDTMSRVKDDFSNLPKHVQQAWREDYFPHFWKDPDKARQLMVSRETSGGIKMGSKASLNARSMPTIEEGLRHGLEPKFTNPIDASLRYMTSMRQALKQDSILQQGLDSGNIIRARAESMGASGSGAKPPNIPDGYTELDGPGRGHWAPTNFARVYNNYVSQGFHANQEAGSVYDAIRKTGNVGTMSLLALSGYHGITMSEASMSTQFARAIGKSRAAAGALGQGDVKGAGRRAFDAAKTFGTTPFAPIAYAYRGKKARDAYLHPSFASPEDREIAEVLTGGGQRAVGRGHATDFEASAMGDYWKTFQRGMAAGGAKAGARRVLSEIGQPFRETMDKRIPPALRGTLGPAGRARQAALPLEGAAKTVAQGLARSMQTVMKPLFDDYIPSIKNGANYHMMADWLKEHPNAGHTEKLAAARNIVDMTDARFGEMIQDNIFWNKTLKQSAMAAMLSYSWNVGNVKTLGAGARDIARMATGQGAGTAKADYLIATTIMWSTMNTMYQYLKTKQAPWQSDTPAHDMLAARTGGSNLTLVPPHITREQLTSQYGIKPEQIREIERGKRKQIYVQTPERLLPPGVMKDVIGFYNHPMQEAINKLNPAMKTIVELGRNSDWKDDPILAPKDEGTKIIDQMPEWLGNTIMHLGGLAPISVQNMSKPKSSFSNISTPENLLGVRQAMRPTRDPFYGVWESQKAKQRWDIAQKKAARSDARRKNLEKAFGGPQ